MASFPVMNRFRRIQPKREAFEEYRTALQEQPQQEDFSPSVWRRIAAGLAGGLTGLRDPEAGMKISSGIIQDPYNRAVAEHGRRTSGLEKLAKLEQDSNEASADYENDVMQREETARFHDLTNQRWEEDREQRQTAAQAAAEQRAMATDNEATFKEAELERRSKADALLAAHRDRMAGIARQRANAYGKFVGKYGSKPESDRVNPIDQQRIRKLAVIETMRDPRFAKVPVELDGSYDTNKLDPALQQEFEQALRIHESTIAKKKKSDYDFTGNADITEDDFEFERRLKEEDEEDNWF